MRELALATLLAPKKTAREIRKRKIKARNAASAAIEAANEIVRMIKMVIDTKLKTIYSIVI